MPFITSDFNFPAKDHLSLILGAYKAASQILECRDIGFLILPGLWRLMFNVGLTVDQFNEVSRVCDGIGYNCRENYIKKLREGEMNKRGGNIMKNGKQTLADSGGLHNGSGKPGVLPTSSMFPSLVPTSYTGAPMSGKPASLNVSDGNKQRGGDYWVFDRL